MSSWPSSTLTWKEETTSKAMWGQTQGLLLSKKLSSFSSPGSHHVQHIQQNPSICIQKGACHTPSSVSRINIYPVLSRCPSTLSLHIWETLLANTSFQLWAAGRSSCYSGFWYLLGEPWRTSARMLRERPGKSFGASQLGSPLQGWHPIWAVSLRIWWRWKG